MRYRKWTDEQIIRWANLYSLGEDTFLSMENNISVSHSTIYWCFEHKLKNIDSDLYDRCRKQMNANKYTRRKSV